jgi:hypothetical protein
LPQRSSGFLINNLSDEVSIGDPKTSFGVKKKKTEKTKRKKKKKK